jgi:hypothetical protein
MLGISYLAENVLFHPSQPMFHFDPHVESRGWRKCSQSDEDGILEYIFSILPAGPLGRYFVEFGISPSWGRTLEQSGLEGNCRLLQEKGWRGYAVAGAMSAGEPQLPPEKFPPVRSPAKSGLPGGGMRQTSW